MFLDNDDPLNPAGGALSVGAGGGAAVSGQARKNPVAAGKGSGAWTNLDQYINANAGMGDQFAGNFEQKTAADRGALESGWDELKTDSLGGVGSNLNTRMGALNTAESGLDNPSDGNPGSWQTAFSNWEAPSTGWATDATNAKNAWNTKMTGYKKDPTSLLRDTEANDLSAGGRSLNDYLFSGSGASGRIASAAGGANINRDFDPDIAEINAANDAALESITGGRNRLLSGAKVKQGEYKGKATAAEIAAENSAADTQVATHFGNTGYTNENGDWVKTVYDTVTTQVPQVTTVMENVIDGYNANGSPRYVMKPVNKVIMVDQETRVPRKLYGDKEGVRKNALTAAQGSITAASADPDNWADYAALEKMISQYGGAQ